MKIRTIFLFILLQLISLTAYSEAGSLFDYRGMFSADRPSDASIVNYMLIKQPISARFAFETPDGKTEDRVKLVSIVLSSNSKISFKNNDGIDKLNLPEAGIYELKIVPKKNFFGEVKFILRVFKTNTNQPMLDVSQKQLTLSKVDKHPVEQGKQTEIKKAKISLSDASILIPGSAPSDDNNIDENAGSISTQSQQLPQVVVNASEAGDVTQQIENVTSNEDVESETIKTTQINLVEPKSDEFINPYNGFRFLVQNEIGTNTISLKKYIKISLWDLDGKREQVEGTFYSEGPGNVTFLPREIVPGAVYHIDISDCQTEAVVKSKSCYALPKVTGRFIPNADKYILQISWDQNPKLLPNPSGQMIRLKNIDLSVLSESEASVLNLNFKEKMPPVAFIKGCKIQGAPYQVTISIPQNINGTELKAPSALLTCKISGNNEPVEIAKLKVNEPLNNQNDEIDFSNVPALPREIETVASRTFALSKVLSGKFQLKLCKAFQISDNPKESKVIWPQDICWDASGNIWVLDSQGRKVYNFTENGRLILFFGKKGDNDGELGFPMGIVYKDGFLYITDMRNHCIHKFLLDGTYAGKVKAIVGDKSELKLPTGLCFRNNELWVADKEGSKVLCFDAGKTYLGGFKTVAATNSIVPISVRAASEALYILSKSGAVRKFTPMGKFLNTVISDDKKERGISASKTGYLFAAEPDEGKIRVYSPDGTIIETFSAPDNNRKWMPVCLSLRDDGRLAIADASEKMIYIMQIEPVK